MKRMMSKFKRRLYKVMVWLRSKTKSTELYDEIDLRCGITRTITREGSVIDYSSVPGKRIP